MITKNETFTSQLDRWLQEQSPVERVRSPGYLLIGTTSKALKSIGMEDNRIYFGKSKVQKIMNKHPEMTPKVIKRIPEVLEYPVMVLQSQTVMNRITLFGEVLDSAGKPVLVALELLPQNKRGEVLDFAVIASAYGKNNVQQLISHSDILYIDPNKKRTDSWLRLLRLQLPSRVTNYGSINRITFVPRDVNGIFQSKTGSLKEKTAVEIALERAREKAENSAMKKEGNMKYYDIDETAARRAKDANSFYDYKPGSATAEYRQYIDEAVAIAERQKKRVDPMYHEKIDGLLDTYARKLAENMNNSFAIESRIPSILIAGGGNFPVRKKEKQNAARDKNMEEYQGIQGLLDKIRSTGMGGISADDPQAVEKLQSKLAGLEKSQETMKAVNAYYRKDKTLDGCPHLSREQIEKLKADMSSQWHLEDKPFASWALSNNNAEIRRVKERIKSLLQQKETGYAGWEFSGGRVEANTDANRLQIFFDEKPDEAARAELKSNGFRWSPKEGAWQRQLTNNAYRAAKRIERIRLLPPEVTSGTVTPQVAAAAVAGMTVEEYAANNYEPRSSSQEAAMQNSETKEPTEAAVAPEERRQLMTRTRYTQEEYRLAREVNVLDYLRDNGYELQKAGKDFQLREHNSLKISKDGKWYWYSRDMGGSSPIELVRQLNGDSNPISAIKELAAYARGGSTAAEPSMVNTGRSKKDPTEEEKREFKLPERNINDKRAFAYLQETRGIDPEIISACMATGLLYESKQYYNVVFVGQRDDQGQVRHASLRGTYTNAAKPFKGDVSGSDKTYSFALQGAPESHRLYVCESAIDVLSHASMTMLDGGDWRRDHRLALGGMSQASLDYYLQGHPEIKELVICLDNDIDGKGPDGRSANHGQIRAAALAAEYTDRGYTVENYVPAKKDLNEELQSRRKQSKHMETGKKFETTVRAESTPTVRSTTERKSKAAAEPADFDDVAKPLEEGIKNVFTSEHYREYLKVLSKFHAYSFNNVLLIQQQNPNATRVAGLQAWRKKFGRSVKPNEKGMQILAPIEKIVRSQVEGHDPVTGEKMQETKETKKVIGYKPVTVFDVSQTEGKELPQLTAELQKNVEGYAEMLAAIQAVSEIPITFKKLTLGVKGFYNSTDQTILINRNMSELQAIKTAVHELAHARLHKDAPELSKSQKETEAESIAFVVCNHFGLDTSGYSFPYLASWSEGQGIDALKKSLKTIKKEAGKIIGELTREIENQRDNQLAKAEQSAEDKLELVPVAPEEMKRAAEKNIWLSGPEQDGQPTMMRAADLDQNKSLLPHTYDQYLLTLFREGFAKNPLQTLSLFGAAYKDNGLNQIILLKDPAVKNALDNAKSVSSCMRIIQGQLITGNEIPGKVKVQINWSEAGLSSGQFFTLNAANKIFGEFETQARSAGRIDQTQFALYVETQKGIWKYGESRMEFGSGSASDLMDFIQKTMPPEIVEKCEKVFKQQEKNLNEQAGPAKKMNEEKERERVN